jgi:hypothetical protein
MFEKKVERHALQTPTHTFGVAGGHEDRFTNEMEDKKYWQMSIGKNYLVGVGFCLLVEPSRKACTQYKAQKYLSEKQ